MRAASALGVSERTLRRHSSSAIARPRKPPPWSPPEMLQRKSRSRVNGLPARIHASRECRRRIADRIALFHGCFASIARAISHIP
eukprot:3425050-Prymnesium_polylepis.1